MANYTIDQILGMASVPQQLKDYVGKLKESKLPLVSGRVFQAPNQTALVTVLNADLAKYNNAKQKRDAKQDARNQCFEILTDLIGQKALKKDVLDVNGNPIIGEDGKRQKEVVRPSKLQIISAAELLPKLQALKASIEAEAKFVKVDKALEATGMTKEQLIEYLQGK